MTGKTDTAPAKMPPNTSLEPRRLALAVPLRGQRRESGVAQFLVVWLI